MMATTHLATASGASDDLKHVLDTARDALDHEFQRAERLDAKARGQATLAGSWFTVALTASALVFRSGNTPAWLTITLVGCLILGGLSLALLLHASSRVWRLQTRDEVTPATLDAMEQAAGGDPNFARNMIKTYRAILDGAQQANAARATALEPTKGRFRSPALFWWGVLFFGLIEVIAALLSRVL